MGSKLSIATALPGHGGSRGFGNKGVGHGKVAAAMLETSERYVGFEGQVYMHASKQGLSTSKGVTCDSIHGVFKLGHGIEAAGAVEGIADDVDPARQAPAD